MRPTKPANRTDLTQAVPCPCGEWEFRVSEGGVGVHTANKLCPRCKNNHLVVFRGHELLDIVRLPGRTLSAVREALDQVEELHPWQRQALLECAQARAEALPKRQSQEAGGA